MYKRQVNVSADNSQPASSVEQTNPAPAAVVPNTPTESSPNAVPATKATTTPVAGQAGQSPVPPMDKNYQELRSWTTRVSQQNADMRKQMEAQTAKIKEMADLITKATEKPYDPDPVSYTHLAPVKVHDHAMDALKYAFSRQLDGIYPDRVHHAGYQMRRLKIDLPRRSDYKPHDSLTGY